MKQTIIPIPTKEITDSDKWVGKDIWICDYRYDDYDKKPIRHVKPTKVLVRSNMKHDVKNVYYSNNHFVPYLKNGKTSNKIIKPFDNTGFRSRTGVALNCFESEEDCYAQYIKQCKTILKGLKLHRAMKIERIDDTISDVERNCGKILDKLYEN